MTEQTAWIWVMNCILPPGLRQSAHIYFRAALRCVRRWRFLPNRMCVCLVLWLASAWWEQLIGWFLFWLTLTKGTRSQEQFSSRTNWNVHYSACSKQQQPAGAIINQWVRTWHNEITTLESFERFIQSWMSATIPPHLCDAVVKSNIYNLSTWLEECDYFIFNAMRKKFRSKKKQKLMGVWQTASVWQDYEGLMLNHYYAVKRPKMPH